MDSVIEKSSVASEFGSGLLGAGIALGCVVPPILHLITGPLGPFIGGFVAANRVRPSARAVAIIAVTVGFALSSFIGGIVAIVSSLTRGTGASELPSFLQPIVHGPGVLVIVVIVFTYGTALSAVGAFVRASITKNKESSTPS